MSEKAQVSFEFGPFRLDTETHSLMRGEESLPLPPKAFETLVLLVRNSGRVLSKKELMEALWPDSFVEEANLTQNIFLLRKALGEEQGEYIKTVPRVGYRFVAPVREIDGGAALVGVSRTRQHVVVHEEVVEQEEETPETPGTKSLPPGRTASTYRRVSAPTLIVGAIVIATIIGGIVWFNRERKSKAGLETAAPIDSIAVLPFANQARDADSEYLSDGITESLINSLTQVRGLRVVPRTTVFHYKGREADAQTIGRELKVRAVLVGRLLQRGDTLSIQTELIDIDNETQLWGEQYNRKLLDVLAIQNDIASEISNHLRLKISSDQQKQLTKNQPANTEAYQLYLRGNYFASKFTKDGFGKSVDYFNRAIALEPNYALAYNGLAYAYINSDDWFIPPNEAGPKAREAARRALAIDDSLADAHNSLAIVAHWYDWDWRMAESEFQRAIELNPNEPRFRGYYSWYLAFLGRNDEAITQAQRAVQLDPVSAETNFTLGSALFFCRQYDKAIQQLRDTVDLDPNYWVAHDFLGRAYEASGRLSEAISEFQRAVELEKDAAENWSNLGHAYALSGKREEALKIIDKLKKLSAKNYVRSYCVAMIYAGLGDKDDAFVWLDRAYGERSFYMTWLKIDPQLDSLRSDTRFTDLIQRVGLPK